MGRQHQLLHQTSQQQHHQHGHVRSQADGEVYDSAQRDTEGKEAQICNLLHKGWRLMWKLGDLGNSYEQFLGDLQQKDGSKDDCRFAVYDYEYKYHPDGAEAQFKSKIFLLCWCPDSSAIKKKMLYSSSFDTLKRAFVGVHKVIQANGQDEVEQSAVEEILRATDRN